MTHFARTRNAVPVRADAVPFVEIQIFRREVLQAIDAGGRLLLLTGLSQKNGETRLLAAIADDAQGEIALSSTIVGAAYPALTTDCAAAQHFEREIHEQWNVDPQGHPWLKPVRFPPTGPAIGKADFFKVAGAEIHEVAVGPVHAGIIEPGHFRFNCHGERVIHLEISLGYQHRGIERALQGGPHRPTVHLAETIAGDTTAGHTTAYCQIVEGLSGTVCSPRARAWRTLALELERIANHIGDLGALAGDVGFLPAAAFCGRLRGDALNMTALLCGSRLGRGWVRPGGITLDPAAETLRELKRRMQDAERDMRNAVDLLWKSSSVRGRFENAGILTRQAAADLGAVGPVARASGIDRDARRDFPAPLYSERHPSVAVGDAGDVFARAQQRWREIENSVMFIRQLLDEPAGGAARSVLGELTPNAIIASIVEGWRGEILHLALTDPAGRFARYKIVDPSFRNWFALATAMRGQAIMDFPLCNKSFNLSYCGHDLWETAPVMFKTLLARARQGYRTTPYPVPDPGLPALFRGRPVLDPAKCVDGCAACVDVCPTDALRVSDEAGPELDLGRCIFCSDCVAACPDGAIALSRDWRVAASKREGLVATGDRPLQIDALGRELRRLLGRSLRLRQVSAGGCNGCEVEVNALGNVVFDASRFGIDFVASPRHADGVLVTGPVTANMKEALLMTYEAIAEPKLVIAAGACAISGGLFRDHQEVSNGIEGLLPVDLYVPGCPPHPLTILDGLLRLLDRL